MRYYPMFVSLAGRACLVVGAGQVGLRKIETLADCNAASILVVDKNPPDEALAALLKRPDLRSRLSFVQRDFLEDDLDGGFLAIASTSSPAVNQRISDLCGQRGVLCNIVDQPEACTFIVPATVRRGDLTLAISTGGQSPALAKRIRKDLQEAFGQEYALFLDLMGRLRPLVLSLGLDTAANTEIFRALVGSRLLEALRLGDAELAKAELAGHFPHGSAQDPAAGPAFRQYPCLHAQLFEMITEIMHGPA